MATSLRQTVITVTIPGHGTYIATAEGVDKAMTDYLPASRERLRTIVTERSGIADWSGVTTVIEFLIILADFDQQGTVG